jgi:superfamily I DNA and/or RNA helicase
MSSGIAIQFDPEQIRVMNKRMYAKDIAAVIGPPGSGKTTVGSALARNMICEGVAKKVLLTAYTNSATDEFSRELCYLLGDKAAQQLCIRTGNINGADKELPIKFSNNAETIKGKNIILCTTMSLAKLPSDIKFDRLIIDEASINKVDQLLMPMLMGLKASSFSYKSNFGINDYKLSNLHQQLKELFNFLAQCGIAATVVGDPKQSQPINLSCETSPYAYYNSLSAIDWLINSASHDTLHITHRLPDRLACLVDDFAQYGGLRSAPEVASRRLELTNLDLLEVDFKGILDPDEVVTWIDVDKSEEIPFKESSWVNQTEARACVKICKQLVKLMTPTQQHKDEKRIVIITRFTGQAMTIRNLLARMDLLDSHDIRVTTTTSALGTQGDIVLFSLVRNNKEKYLGALGELQDLNVSISRAKQKLIIVGSFDMMINGYNSRTRINYARNLAKLVESKYGKVIEAPLTLK